VVVVATQNDSMNEGLKKVLSTIAQFKVLPDADGQFLAQLEGLIVDKLKNTGAQAAGVSPGGPGGGPPGGALAGLLGAMGGGGGMAPPSPNAMAPGGMAGGGMGGLTTPPNPDELRRVLAGAGGGMNG
jgi:hypothetical protein